MKKFKLLKLGGILKPYQEIQCIILPVFHILPIHYKLWKVCKNQEELLI